MICNILIFEKKVSRPGSLASWLLKKGGRVWETGLQEEAVDLLQAEDIDVVLVDVREIKEEGLALLRKIKGLGLPTEVILLTAPGQIALSIQGMKLGAFDDLLVPIDVEVLAARIEAAAGRKRQNQRVFKVTGRVSSPTGLAGPGLSERAAPSRSGSPVTSRA